jgi:hypothetical protein
MSRRSRTRARSQQDPPSEIHPQDLSQPRLVAYDYSGSTETIAFYHDTVQRILRPYEPYDVILWDNQLEVSDSRSLKQINRQRDGRGGTRPQVVAQYCVEHQIKGEIILITDGQILPRHTEELDTYLNTNPMVISSLECYLIQTAEDDHLDATVIAPFIRRFPHRVLMFRLNSRDPIIVTSGGGTLDELLEEIRNINSIVDFQAKFEHLFTEIVSKMLGMTEDMRLRDEIVQLQRRLLNEMKALPSGFDISGLRQAFAEGTESSQIRLCTELLETYHRTWNEPSWPPQIFHLIKMCTGNLGSVYSLSALGSRFQANRIRRAEVVEHIELSEVQIVDGPQSFTCPISYEEESDIVILIRKPKEGLLAGESPELTNSVITNPLLALHFPDFCEKIVNHLDHPIALRSMKEAEEAGYPITQSPLTRAPIIGGLFLGGSEEHSRATNFALSHLATEGKRVGHPDLWFMLIWWLIERHEVKHLESVLPQIRAHLSFRLRNHLGTITLANTPYLPITLVPLGIAVWCTLSSIALGFSQEQAIQLLKPHSGHLEVLERAIGLINYNLPIAARDLLIKWRIFGEIRKSITQPDSELRLWGIRACHNIVRLNRRTIRSDLFTRIVEEIPIDGEPPTEQVTEALKHLPNWFVELSTDRRRAVARMLEFTDVGAINYSDFDYEVPIIGWGYGLQEFEIPEVPICPKTCRPYYIDPTKQIVWHEASRNIFGEVRQQIHIHWYFIDCVTKLKTFPTKDEFILFVFNSIVPKQKATLPFLIERFAEVVFNGYESIMREIESESFISRVLHSSRLRTREAMESGKTEPPPPAPRRPARTEPPPRRERHPGNHFRRRRRFGGGRGRGRYGQD